jgi:hypothetical protein
LEHWKDFFVAEVGASAALAGLFVVAVSINVARIVATNGLPQRAKQALYTISYVLISSSLGLFPGLTLIQYGWASLILAIFFFWNALHFLSVSIEFQGPVRLIWVFSTALGSLYVGTTLLVGAILLMKGRESGLYWTAGSVLLALATTLQHAWALMVEILQESERPPRPNGN